MLDKISDMYSSKKLKFATVNCIGKNEDFCLS